MRDLLLISDLHLGSHMKARTRGEYVHLAARIDEAFPRFLDHYARNGEWQLIINGDLVDFWNIEIGDASGDPEGVAVERVRAVLDAYPGVEEGLVRFLEAGHGVVIVAGNHDTEFIYPRVRKAMVERLEGGIDRPEGSIAQTGMTLLAELEGGRVSFVPWFLREEGGAWIEHGHLFDAACSTGSPLAPTRGGRLVKTVAEVATRRFSNLMPEIDYGVADRFTTMEYLRWALARGHRFLLRVVLLYLKMVGHMAMLWARGGVDRAGRRLHEERLRRVAANAGLQMSALTALQQMAPPPTSATVWGVLSVTAMDLILGALGPLLLVPLLVLVVGGPLWVGVLVGAVLAVVVVHRIRRHRSVRSVAEDMLRVAAHVGEVTRVPLVLMGHSHFGSLERRGEVIYGNSGSWLDGSHLVVRRDRGTGKLDRVELRKWRNGGVCRVGMLVVGDARPEATAEHEVTLQAAMGGAWRP